MRCSFTTASSACPTQGWLTRTRRAPGSQTRLSADVSVVMLDNHGVLVIGSSIPDAWQKLYFLERACMAQVLAQSTGSPLRLASSAVAEHTAHQWKVMPGADAQFAAVRRSVDRLSPGWET